MNLPSSSFPGGTSVTWLDVYDDAAPDGLRGGSPHVHLASTECYVVAGGRGALHTLDPSGARERTLVPGSVVWFTPGTIHRAVNHGDLRVLVVMGNAGLPEAGDAVMTFPNDVVGDPERYHAAATLPDASEGATARSDAARRRRDLAVEGYLPIRDALLRGDDGPLREFHAAAAELVAGRAASWSRIVTDGPLAQAQRSLQLTTALEYGSAAHLADARVEQGVRSEADLGFGMCGRLRTYDVAARPRPVPIL
ncbi:cupin domain-containing protein [Agromyces mariniharenae]|uniref:Cupin domain-containing protein n=1 Tax=Agromyces mariniharenae TaxID=2604423 RepID=A0A5S4V529_9MICO|nr:cupin domain-containing protein [Agromyces mariniharenae]TYL53139.1 cupin domain-containing protein [Agromyces mariniharenae]